MKRVLVMGRKPGIIASVSQKYGDLGLAWCEAGDVAGVESALQQYPDIAIAIMGAGLDDRTRGRLIAVIAGKRPDISIHLKDRESGPAGMASFVHAVVTSSLVE